MTQSSATYDVALDTSHPPVESLSVFARVLIFLYLAVAMVYLAWRATTLNPDAPVFSGLLYGAELFGFSATLLHLFMVWRLSVRKSLPAPAGLKVDIFVPTFNEPVDMVRRTLLAARNVDYAHGTWLLDDGNRPEMRALAVELGIRYLAREHNTHAKAGNLNNALLHSTADFIAIFDADHAPKRNFLDETLGYFRDPKLGFVQTPQDFFNLDSYQHRKAERDHRIWTEQSLFFRVIQRGKDVWNAAFFCGSCAVIRRSALDEIGGFATRSITEDLETSVAVHRAGYRSVYVPEPLAFGIAPSSASPFLKQRVRWGQGAMQVIRQEWFFLRGKLTLAQRLNYMASTLTYFDGWQKAIFYLAPVWVLTTGTMPLITDVQTFLMLFVPYFILTFLVFEEAGRGFGRSALIEQYNMARFAAFAWATVGLFRRNLRFKVTAKNGLSATQTEARIMSPQIVVAGLNILAIAAGVILWSFTRHLPVDGLLANIVWASINFLMAFLVVRFTLLRTRFKRKDYRFPVPLPAQVSFGEAAARVMTVDDISSSGCRLYGQFPRDLPIGAEISGQLLLPGDTLPFTAKVAALIPGVADGETYTKAIGLAFEWPGDKARDRLDLFLYGSDLQWQLHGLSDRIRTPTEFLQSRTESADADAQYLDSWAAVEVASNQQVAESGMLSRPHGPDALRIMASFRRLDGDAQVPVREFTRRGAQHINLRPTRGLAQVSTPTGVLYLTEMATC
ncbi:MAG TPA: glycosyltransferase [Arenimonas sp.]|nr:glycosyltransferase [Arenimonas sp.]